MSIRFIPRRWKFAYGDFLGMTVTVKATSYQQAHDRACIALDLRYERQDKEPPVAWTLGLITLKTPGATT